MKLFSSIFIAASLLCSPVFAAEGHGTADEAIAMTKRAISFLKTNGKDKTLAAINGKDPQFTDRDLYVIVWDMKGVGLAHGANPKMVGKDLAEAQDVDGKFYAKERLELAKTKTSFWHDYKWSNPLTKKIESKSTYCETADAMIFCVGIYK